VAHRALRRCHRTPFTLIAYGSIVVLFASGMWLRRREARANEELAARDAALMSSAAPMS
jgi:hypothetical protein